MVLLLSSTDGKALWIALNEVQIFTTPVEHFERRIEFV